MRHEGFRHLGALGAGVADGILMDLGVNIAPLFAGAGAGSINVTLASADGLATAPAGAPAGSRDTSNLAALIASYAGPGGPASGADALLLGLSSRVSALETRTDGLAVVSASAEAELLRETGVDLDTEAANLIRLQQAFEAIPERTLEAAATLRAGPWDRFFTVALPLARPGLLTASVAATDSAWSTAFCTDSSRTRCPCQGSSAQSPTAKMSGWLVRICSST